MEMTRLVFQVGIAIPTSDFESEWESNPGRLAWFALEHGDACGEFSSYVRTGISTEEYEESE